MPDYPPSGRGHGYETHFYIFGAQAISLEWINLVCRLNVKSNGITNVKVLQHGVHLRSRDLLKFWEIGAHLRNGGG